ncbi:MAG: HD domain-containing protein [Methanobacteriota archaeon]|nr:MAG: HD domain-containing protein [Euryarchaeota archaeon]
MSHHWVDIFPELELIQDVDLKSKVMQVYDEAMKEGGWTDLKPIPFSLLVETELGYIDHVRAVTRIAIESGKIMKEGGFDIDMDVLVAGGLLHDIGKLLEYTTKEGKVVKSEYGKHLRHPISGAILAKKFGLGDKVVNIIAGHSKEGDHGWRCNEAIIIHHADFTYFHIVKATQ